MFILNWVGVLIMALICLTACIEGIVYLIKQRKSFTTVVLLSVFCVFNIYLITWIFGILVWHFQLVIGQ